ncbi:MAG: dihydrofolate reductase family protein [Prevotellaceae bacterium]|nr:dihydrofolate reductase family protein [Prevotellaceae bacterium]
MRPYIICHIIASIDGRIDCSMVDKISGNEYYDALEQLDCPSHLEGRVTMEHYSAEPGTFIPKVNKTVGNPSFYVAQKADGYAVSVDTKGRLMWKSNEIDGEPIVCILSELVSEEYLEYLKEKGISWIVTGKEKIDLCNAMEILYEQFGVKRLSVLGGGNINGGFLEAGLLDEISVMIAAGVDGRKGQTSLFDGIADMNRLPVPLTLTSFEKIGDSTLWIRYKVNN